MSNVAADLLGSCTKTSDSVGYYQVDLACTCVVRSFSESPYEGVAIS